MSKQWQIPRRAFLRGIGTTMALPLLEAMSFPSRLLAETPAAPGALSGKPLRMAFVYVPNGVNMADWTPRNPGADYELPFILEPLKPLRDRFQVVSGLAHQKAFANGDGAGDHARASATFLTGTQARKTAAVNIRAGISVDQVAAAQMGDLTRIPSLELSCDRGQQAGSCDSGYSCAYQFNLAWKSETTPLAPEVDPRIVFERLFGNGKPAEMAESRARRERNKKSVLDFVLEDSKRLKSGLGSTDRRKVDEFMNSVREVERRIERAEKFPDRVPDYPKPTGIPTDYEEHIRVLYDLLAMAFQMDATRISTFMVAHDGSNRSYPFIGVSDGHHDLSHHGGNEVKKQKIARINRFHLTQFAYFLEKLKSIKEGNETLLDQCMIVYGSGISDGDQHAHNDLPVLLAGRGAGTLSPGRHIRYSRDTPMSNLYLSMLNRMGTPVSTFGDSTGLLSGLV